MLKKDVKRIEQVIADFSQAINDRGTPATDSELVALSKCVASYAGLIKVKGKGRLRGRNASRQIGDDAIMVHGSPGAYERMCLRAEAGDRE